MLPDPPLCLPLLPRPSLPVLRPLAASPLRAARAVRRLSIEFAEDFCRCICGGTDVDRGTRPLGTGSVTGSICGALITLVTALSPEPKVVPPPTVPRGAASSCSELAKVPVPVSVPVSPDSPEPCNNLKAGSACDANVDADSDAESIDSVESTIEEAPPRPHSDSPPTGTCLDRIRIALSRPVVIPGFRRQGSSDGRGREKQSCSATL